MFFCSIYFSPWCLPLHCLELALRLPKTKHGCLCCKVFVFSCDICAQWKVENYDWKMPLLPETTMTILLSCTEKKENNSCVSWEVLSGICQKLWTQGWLHTSCAQMIAMNAVDNAFSWRNLNTNLPKQHSFLSGLRNFKNISKIALPKFPQKREHKTHFPTNYDAESVFTSWEGITFVAGGGGG